jgi:hypothetical protein
MTIELPFEIGDFIYHKVRAEKVRGMVKAFHIEDKSISIKVIWGDDLTEAWYSFNELTDEFSNYEVTG